MATRHDRQFFLADDGNVLFQRTKINTNISYTVTVMPSILVEVLRIILEHGDTANLVTLCQVNKMCCSCSQDIFYREIDRRRALQTFAQSTNEFDRSDLIILTQRYN